MDTENVILFKRYLYLNNKDGIYSRCLEDTYEKVDLEKLNFLKSLLDVSCYDLILQTLRECHDNRFFWNRSQLLNVLALCCRAGNAHFKEQVYKLTGACLKTPSELLYFMHCAQRFRSGFGRGLRSLAEGYYKSLTLWEFANMLCERSKFHGWTHEKVFKLCHININNSDKLKLLAETIFKGSVKPTCGANSPELNNCIARVQILNDASRCRNEGEVAKYVSQYGLKPNQLSEPALQSLKVWEFLVQHASLDSLLAEMPRLRRLGFLKHRCSLHRLFKEVLEDPVKRRNCKSKPVEVFAAAKDYHRGREVNPRKKMAIMKRLREDNKPYVPLPFPDRTSAFTPAFNRLLNACASNVEPVGDNILCVFSPDVSQRTCRNMSNVTTTEAISLLVFTLYKVEPNVTFATFNETSVIPVAFQKGLSYQMLFEKFRELHANGFNYLCGPNFALKHQRKFDTFIYLVPEFEVLPKSGSDAQSATEVMKNYRDTADLPTARMIVMGMSSYKVPDGQSTGPGVFYICGLDKNVHSVMQACIQKDLL